MTGITPRGLTSTERLVPCAGPSAAQEGRPSSDVFARSSDDSSGLANDVEGSAHQ